MRGHTVIYDRDCNICQKIVTALGRWDRSGRLEIVASRNPGVRARFPWITEREFTESLQVVRESDGKTWRGAAAIEQLLDILPRGGCLSWVFSIPTVRGLAERFYRWFARNRYRMGCSEHCVDR